MKYISTRGNQQQMDAAGAIIAGLADDGGLFVPEEIPQVTAEFIAGLAPLSYKDRARQILRLFLTDYTDTELVGCIDRAYGGDKFDAPQVAPLRNLDDVSVLELWHGPTSAFKDMALQLLPQLMCTALQKTGEQKQLLILVATSGDTGKAALDGFHDVPQIKIQVFYPEGGVSQIQHLQMATQVGGNVSVMAVQGNFDDAQSGVKKIFGDEVFNAHLEAAGTRLSSANSINWGRLVPQIVYYFSAYADLLQCGKIQNGDRINFTVPTGNFGNILAGFYARRMGLPIFKLICASNANNVLTDFLQTGYYDRNRAFYKTITPSMDILISSNLERLLYHLTGDTAQIKNWMQALADEGRYDVGEGMLQRLQNFFWADWADDARTAATIKEVYAADGYVPDTHTAVAWAVARAYQRRTEDRRPMVIVSTASPYKFNDSVLQSLGIETAGQDPFALLDRLAAINRDSIPKGLTDLRQAVVLHKGVCTQDDMKAAVLAFSQK